VRAEELRTRLERTVLLLDGAMGSLLMAAGLPPGRAPEWWNLEHPDRVAKAHRGYVEAGSDIIQTNTFGGSPSKLRAAGLGGRCREVNARAVEIARRASAGAALVAGDLGPTGLMLPPVGGATVEEMREALCEQAATLADAGVDLIAIETMYDLREALVAVEAARSTGLPVLASMTFESRKRGFFTIMGDPLAGSLAALADAGADAVGCNCTVTAQAMLAMVVEARKAVGGPIVAQPNAGQPRVTPEGTVYDESPEEFARGLAAIANAGARVVGGCCGTTAEFITHARAALDVAVGRG
jgi:5-methyltetrahydrofolate--homocysteine methyltransferase